MSSRAGVWAGGYRGRGHRSSAGSGLRTLLGAHCGQGEGSPLALGRGGGSEDAGPASQQHRPRGGREVGRWAEGPDLWLGPGWSCPARRSLTGSADDSPHAPGLPPAMTRGREGERLLRCRQQGGILREAWALLLTEMPCVRGPFLFLRLQQLCQQPRSPRHGWQNRSPGGRCGLLHSPMLSPWGLLPAPPQ